MKALLQKVLPFVAGLSFVCLVIAAPITFAAETTSDSGASKGVTFTPLTQLPQIQSAASADTLPVFLNQLYKICIGIGTVLAFFMIIRAGIEFMVSRGSVSSNENAKKHLQGAILGLILLLSPVVVFSIINPDILKLTLDFGSLGIKDPPPSAPQDPGPAGLAQQQCSTIVKQKSIDLKVGQDQAGQCTALGKGWAKYNASCCSITDSNHLCCGYDPKNDQTPVQKDPGKYSFTGYFKTEDDHGACLLKDSRTFDSQSACTTALTKWQSDSQARKYTFAVANNCNASGNLQVGPVATWDQISSLPTCQE